MNIYIKQYYTDCDHRQFKQFPGLGIFTLGTVIRNHMADHLTEVRIFFGAAII